MTYIDENNNNESETFNKESALFALEDILGGSSAVANIILRILFDLALDPNADIQTQIHDQIDILRKPNDGLISIEEKQQIPLVVAAMHETIRMTCSPIVPHQATQDSDIGGTYFFRKPTVSNISREKVS